MPVQLPSLILAAAMQAYSGGDFLPMDQLLGEARNARFGEEIANAGDINGDGIDDLIVSAQHTSNSVFGSMGRIYVYSGADQSLIHSWEGIAEKVELGVSIANAGDVNGDGINDIMAGAAGNLTGVAAYVEVWSGADGALLLHLDEVQADSYFGQHLSAAGDVNSDGYGDFIVSAIRAEANGHEDAGSAYVYSGWDGTMLYQIDGVGAHSQLGLGITELDDINHDGASDFAIAHREFQPGSFQHVVTVYSGINGFPLIQIDSPQTDDAFGGALQSCPDLNGDGIRDLFIGAPSTDVGNLQDAGAAFAFSSADGSLLHSWFGQTAGENFGWSIASGQDLNADGFWDLAIGAPNYNAGSSFQAGAISLYSSNDGHMLHRVLGPNFLEHYGLNLVLLSDSNGTGSAEFCTGRFNGGPQAEGIVTRFDFVNYLSASQQEIEARSGALIHFDFDFPASAAGHFYHLLVSASGVGPTERGVLIPLSSDYILNQSSQCNYPVPGTFDLSGTLDGNGNATGFCVIPPISNTALIGQTFYVAAVAYPSGGLPDHSSGAVPLTVVP